MFGWGQGGLQTISQHQHQHQLQALPPRLQNALSMLGGAEEIQQAPTPTYCLKMYCANHQTRIQSASWLMPIAEMINHDVNGLPYVLEQGVRVRGVVDDEVLTCYHRHLDAFHFFFNYHFVAPADTVLSCDVTVPVPAVGTFHIARMDHLVDAVEEVRTRRLTQKGAIKQISFVEIANRKKPSQPRQTLTRLLATRQVPASVANALFDGLQEHNRQVLTGLIHTCQAVPGAMARSLEQIAAHQLAVLA